MKIKPEHYELMKTAIEALVATKPDAYAEYQKAGLSDMRYNWDVFRAAKVEGNTTRFICDVLYPYLNDDHINTALKRILGNTGHASK